MGSSLIRVVVVVVVVVACDTPPEEPDEQPTCDEAVVAADIAMAAIDPGVCVDDGGCVFDGGNICGIDIAEFAYAADDAFRVKAAVQEAWADACEIGSCGLHEDTFLLAARCDAGRCRLADTREVCAAHIDAVRAQVEATLDRSCDVADDCGVVDVDALCGEHRFQLQVLARVQLERPEVVVSCEVLAQGMRLNCFQEAEFADSDLLACADGVCAVVVE
jgi:hypothetical protein